MRGTVEILLFCLFGQLQRVYTEEKGITWSNLQEGELLSCVDSIIRTYFSNFRNVLVSMPENRGEGLQRTLTPSSFDEDVILIVNMLLKKMSANFIPYRILPRDENLNPNGETVWGYIIFLWPDDDGDIMDSLRNQLDSLKDSESTQWEPRARFIVMVIYRDNHTPQELALEVYTEMWSYYRTINTIIVITNQDENEKSKHVNETNKFIAKVYTGFPYQTGNCGEVKEVILLDQCQSYKYPPLSQEVNLFPTNTPEHYCGCPLKVSSIGIHPFVYLKKNSTQIYGDASLKVEGMSVEQLLLPIEKMNLTPIFLHPILNLTMDGYLKIIAELTNGISDIVTGTIALIPALISSDYEPTIPFEFSSVSWFLPCPDASRRMEKVITTYSISVWLTMAMIYILTGCLFSCLATYNTPHISKDSNNYRNINLSLYNAWAVLLGVSVPEMPKTWKLRLIFLLYVCYCFVMSTVFQAFFTSFLVAPGYEKEMETVDELVQSDLKFGFNSAVGVGAMTMDYREFERFHYSRHVDCNDFAMCVKRMIYKRDITSIVVELYTNYLANRLGFGEEEKVLCSLNVKLISSGLVFLLKKGSPYLNQLNSLLRRGMEGGLLHRYCELMFFEARLESRNRKEDDETDALYFVFSFSYLIPAFFVLLVGYVAGGVVLVGECFLNCVLKYTNQRAGHVQTRYP
ncbi:hypothetical protein ANN_19795 [Periplaneta americana]|uniref:Ionotropic glutamate receptor C-terminal domain-containing protein n=1 Tax=Periplaneta americana TaxID=6978 RepID=A0ABQ8SB91_PERAM|nr:hypothetical protein ANN_19795 [Periplaneta americana]